MTSIARHLSIGFMALGAAAAMVGCSSGDAGETLTVEFTGPSGLALTSSSSGTSGQTNVVAKVKYRGKKSLVYLWTYSLPVAATATVALEVLTIKVSSAVEMPSGTGTGSATLEVYEKDGTLDSKASTPIVVQIIDTSSG